MSATLGKPPAMQWNEVANVVGNEHSGGLVRGLQLPLVIDSAQPKLIRGFRVNPVLPERLSERVGLAILVQVDSDSAHGVLCGRHSGGWGRLSAQAVFAFNFTGNLIQIRQRVGNGRIDFGQRDRLEFLKYVLRLAPPQKPT